jgi:hypothetical protein
VVGAGITGVPYPTHLPKKDHAPGGRGVHVESRDKVVMKIVDYRWPRLRRAVLQVPGHCGVPRKLLWVRDLVILNRVQK